MTQNERVRVLVVHCDSVAEAGLSSIIARNPDMQLLQLPIDDPSDEVMSEFCAQQHGGVVIADYNRALRLAEATRKFVVPGHSTQPRLLVFTDRATHAEIRAALETHLRHEPEKLSRSRIKRLRGLRQPQYRLRAGDVRIFYDVTDRTVQVLAIVSKQEAGVWLAQFANPE